MKNHMLSYLDMKNIKIKPLLFFILACHCVVNCIEYVVSHRDNLTRNYVWDH